MKRPRFETLKRFHVEQLAGSLQARQRIFKQPLDEAGIAALLAGDGMAALDGDTVHAAGGLIDEKEGLARAWALIGTDMPPGFWPEVVDEMRAGIDAALRPETGWATRVYAETLCDWPEGHKLLLHLGLKLEGLARGRFPGGRHAVTYARVAAGTPPLPTRWRALLEVAETCLWEDTLRQPVPYRRDAA